MARAIPNEFSMREITCHRSWFVSLFQFNATDLFVIMYAMTALFVDTTTFCTQSHRFLDNHSPQSQKKTEWDAVLSVLRFIKDDACTSATRAYLPAPYATVTKPLHIATHDANRQLNCTPHGETFFRDADPPCLDQVPLSGFLAQCM